MDICRDGPGCEVAVEISRAQLQTDLRATAEIHRPIVAIGLETDSFEHGHSPIDLINSDNKIDIPGHHRLGGPVVHRNAAGLLLADRQPNRHAVLEFVLHGARYAFPAVRGRMARGMPTAYAAPPLSNLIHAGLDPIPVWPDPEGEARGESFKPLYRDAPAAARADPRLSECLSLFDALRGGRARERTLATEHLTRLING
jgi:hypothetical protein